ncbi:MAG: universal stress protein [Alphaproteobacteria bacterium]|nr:universal stress protein [Alphaproteobacteria bacterium]
MVCKSILVLMDDTPAATLRARAATAIAHKLGARITGLFMRSDLMRTYGAGEALAFMPPDDIDRLLKRHADAVSEASDQARRCLEQAARDAGTSAAWRTVDGDLDDDVLDCARRCDLVVSPVSVQASLGQNRVSAAQIAMASGGPVLVLPDAGYEPLTGRRIMVAWKGTRESARALRDAWPLLKCAESITVVRVGAGPGRTSDPWLESFFDAHGLTMTFIENHLTDASAADVLRLEMGKSGSDLLVMGVYGASRVRELILGGVSRDLLAKPTFPIFISH